MRKNIILLLAVTVLTASCSLSRTVSSAKTVLPKTDLVLADLDIQTNKVTGEYRYDIQKDLQKTVDKEDIINNAIYSALLPMKADVLVAAQYQIESLNRGNRVYYTVTVSGYPAYYRNFRQSSIKDVELTEINGVVYVIPKNSNGDPIGYQVIVPNDDYSNLVDMNFMSLDKVVLNMNAQGIGGVVEKSTDLSKKKHNGLSTFDMLKMLNKPHDHKKAKKGNKIL